VGDNPQELLKQLVEQLTAKKKHNPTALSIKVEFWRVFASSLERLMTDCWECSQGAEAIIYSELALPGYHIAEKLGVPGYAAYTQPLYRTHAFRHTQSNFQLNSTFNWLTHVFEEQFRWQFTRKNINRWRQETLNLPPIPITGLYRRQQKQQMPALYCYSPAVIPKPSDWPNWAYVTGYCFLNHSPDWQPPAGLVDFLESGSPPVYIGFGSMRSRNPEALTELVLAALAQTGQRGILVTGWGALSNADLPDYVLKIDSVPHDWLFPRMAAVVHHGGSGTTSAGLRAGVPSVIIPFGADQPFWGERVAELGVGSPPILQKELTVERLAAAIRTATSDEAMKACAAALGEQIRSEDGVARAIEVIHRHLSAHKN
jgi:UDP:flavonoid glycosyltransferase YjiC (YdhE family)